jgi:hypothetical protein
MPDAPVPDTTLPDAVESDAALAPAPVARRVAPRPAPAPAPAPRTISRDDALATLGMDADTWERLEKQHQEWEAKKPEIERVRAEHTRLGIALKDQQAKVTTYQKQVAEMAEANFGLHLRSFASDLGREIGLVADPAAARDLYALLDRHSHTAGTGESSTMLYREGTFEVDFADPEARKKLGEHLVKTRSYLIASRLAPGGGGAGRPASIINRNEPPKDRAEFVQQLGMRVMTGGKSAAKGS